MSADLRTPWNVVHGNSYRYEVKDASGHTVARIVGGILDGGEAKAKITAAAPLLADALARDEGLGKTESSAEQSERGYVARGYKPRLVSVPGCGSDPKGTT